jgi:hypothetical protein
MYVQLITHIDFKSAPHVILRVHIAYTPSVFQLDDVLDKVWAKYWEYKSWIIF